MQSDGQAGASREDATPDSGVPRRGRLDAIEVVLVQPQGPRNVGSVARAMRNFGLSRLCLVGGVSPTDPEALEMGVRSHALLEGARRVASYAEALFPATFVVASTAKPRDRCPTASPREAAARILEEAARGRVALVFGREDHGLTAEEVRAAHLTVAIATAPDCRALNLAQAVLLLAYEIFEAEDAATKRIAHSDPGRLADGALRGRLRDELLRMLEELAMLHEGTSVVLTQSIERILTMGPLETRDARVLFAIARRVQKTLGRDADG